MLNKQDNEILTRVGPGTMMGDLLRQYWVPALMSVEVPSPDCPPVRVRLLGENLIGFRTTSGQVGLIQDACPHRAASMFFGRNEEDGIRCVYHGWKFDITGQCTEMLSEPPESNFKNKVRATVYPCVERGGLVWAYMGPRETPPPLPDIEPNMLGDQAVVRANLLEWNWFQILENNMDTAHQGILHFGAIPYEDAIDPEKAKLAYPGQVDDLKYIVRYRHVRFTIRETDFGTSYDGWRPGDEGEIYHRLMHWMWPWCAVFPVMRLGSGTQCALTVPLDDEHTMVWSMTVRNPSAAMNASTGPNTAMAPGQLPNNAGWFGRFRNVWWEEAKANGNYDFGIDREVQKTARDTRGFSGLPSVPVQDGMINWSQGVIVDRSTETLGTTDSMIIRVRRLLIDAAKELRNHGTTPPCVDTPAVYRQRGGWIVLPEGVDYWEATQPLRESFRQPQLATPTV